MSGIIIAFVFGFCIGASFIYHANKKDVIEGKIAFGNKFFRTEEIK